MKLKTNFQFSPGTLYFAFLTYATYSQSREIDSMRDPPCYFNPLCTCSKAIPDLGIVRCQNTFLSNLPSTINTSKVFMLQLDNIGLRTIKPNFLQNTGLYKLSITRNPIYVIPDSAFSGLERTLWRLDLSNNHLLNVPSKALRYLQRLRFLDLTGNRISHVFPESWKGLESSLETLLLVDNSITYLPPDAFTGLPCLETINLKGNNLREIDPSVFRDSMDKLAHVILADNQLTSIPYLALAPLKMLQTLDLSYNRINKMKPTLESGAINIQLDVRLSLDLLQLEYNQIVVLEQGSFQYFNVLNKTYLDGNHLISAEDNAFQQAKIRELYMRDCGLTHVTPEVFAGLEKSLQVLDLSGNNITGLDNEFLIKFEFIRKLGLSNNVLKSYLPVEAMNGFQHTLNELDFSGLTNHPISLDNLIGLRSLRILHLSRLSQKTLNMDDFQEFGADLEELHINFAYLQGVKNRAFNGIHALKILDLSENTIGQLEKDAFIDIAHSLIALQVSSGLLATTNLLPHEALRPLSNLQYLDFSNNKIKSVPDTSFHFLMKLKVVELQDNEIESISKGTFQGNIHTELETIYLSFNSLKVIEEYTFADLPMLEQLHLDDNMLKTLEKYAFINLENIKRLNLKGNKITEISSESFQNLPELEDLDLSYNELTEFHFVTLEQVGTLGSFRVNLSHNKLSDLTVNHDVNDEIGSGNLHTNIKILDLSFNNITDINKQYFHPTELSLTHLYIRQNRLLNISKDVFGNMPHLQLLDVSFNRILEFDSDTFKNTRSLQEIIMANNLIAELPKDVFRYLRNLRVADFSHNRLRFLQDHLFRMEGLERLNISHNQLVRVPLSSFSPGVAETLTELDLSGNRISSITHEEMFSKFESLSWLDLSHNNLIDIEAGVFGLLPKLSVLDLSCNLQLSLDRYGKTFEGIEDSLLFLKLDNMSLYQLPVLPLTNLISLSLAHNSLCLLPQEVSANFSSLQILDLTDNNLTAVPVGIHALSNLKSLLLTSNPISCLTNASLPGFASHLEELDIRRLPLKVLETDTFSKMFSLNTLKIGINNNLKNINIPKLVQNNFGLKDLEIEVEKDTNLGAEMSGLLPPKLKRLEIRGSHLKSLDASVLEGITSPYLELAVYETNLVQVTPDVFDDLRWIRNISLDIKDNENLQYFGSPLTANKPGSISKTFLLDLSLSGNKWSCDCGLAWIEEWQRKRRQYLCDHNLRNLPLQTSPAYTCRHVEDDIRNSICFNKANQSLIEVLKTDIECGWNSASSNYGFSVTFILIVIGFLQY